MVVIVIDPSSTGTPDLIGDLGRAQALVMPFVPVVSRHGECKQCGAPKADGRHHYCEACRGGMTTPRKWVGGKAYTQCIGCGVYGPKARGSRRCPACREEYERTKPPRRRRPKPCVVCGGKKQSGYRGKYCPTCRADQAERAREHARQHAREMYAKGRATRPAPVKRAKTPVRRAVAPLRAVAVPSVEAPVLAPVRAVAHAAWESDGTGWVRLPGTNSWIEEDCVRDLMPVYTLAALARAEERAQ